MTSRSSYWKYSLWNIKKRSWILSLSIGLMFFALPMFTYLSVSGAVAEYQLGLKTAVAYNQMCSSILMGNIYNIIHFFIAIVLGIIMAIQSLSWMNKRQKVDLYKSVPVKEKERFMYIHLNSLFMYAIPLALGLLASNLIILGYGIYNSDFLKASVGIFVVCVLTFMGVYMLVLIAQLLTGNTVLAFFGGVFFLFVEVVCRASLLAFKTQFWDTYCGDTGYSQFATGNLTSPIFSGLCTFISVENRAFAQYNYFRFGAGVSTKCAYYFVLLLLQLIVYTLIAYWLYKKRASQTGGKSIVFKKAVPLIQFAIVFTVSLGVGVLMAIAGAYYEKVNMYGFIGIVLSAIVLHIILCAIMEGDFNSVIRQPKKHLPASLAACVLCCLIFSVYAFDIFGYNTYLPKEDELADFSFVRYYGWAAPQNNGFLSELGDTADMHITDENAKKVLLTVLQDAMDKEQYQSTDTFPQDQTYSVRDDLGVDSDLTYKDRYYCESVGVEYHLKNGRNVKRTYCLSEIDVRKIYSVVYETQGYKNATNLFNNSVVMDRLNSDSYNVEAVYTGYDFESSMGDTYGQRITGEDIDKLCEAMKDDLNARTYTDLLDKAPVGYIEVDIGKVVKGETRWDEYSGAITIIMSVYECDEKTTAFLQSIGINTDTSIPTDEVSKINVYTTTEMDDTTTQLVLELDPQSELGKEVMADAFPMKAHWDAIEVDMLADQDYFIKVISKDGAESQYALYTKGFPQDLKKAMENAVINDSWESRED